LLAVNIWGNNLTQEELQKLHTPIVQVQGDNFNIEEYNAINFTDKIFFDGKSLNRVVVQTKATMKKGVINKEQFIAISASLSDQIMQSIFMSPQYIQSLKSVDWMTQKPKTVNLMIQINFMENGLDVVITNSKRTEKRMISYKELFHQRLR
jgi:hypothetical protein